jgi:hypothetical protein
LIVACRNCGEAVDFRALERELALVSLWSPTLGSPFKCQVRGNEQTLSQHAKVIRRFERAFWVPAGLRERG